jgi:predicted DNA-binding transcriptional regulator YafY
MWEETTLMLESGDAEAIATGLALLRRVAMADAEEEEEDPNAALFARTRALLPVEGLFEPDDAVFDAPEWDDLAETTIDPETLRDSICSEKGLALVYEDAKGRATTRDILPLDVFGGHGTPLILAWCESRRDYRHFRIDRIVHCAPNGRSFRGEGQAMRLLWWHREEDDPW